MTEAYPPKYKYKEALLLWLPNVLTELAGVRGARCEYCTVQYRGIELVIGIFF